MDIASELERIKALHAKDQDAEALAACEALAGALAPATPDPQRLSVLWQRADLRSHADDHDGAVAAYEECRPLIDRLGKARAGVVLANNLGYHHGMKGRREAALAALRESRERSRRLGQPFLLRSYQALAWWHLEWGEGDDAESAARVAVQQARTWNDPADLGPCLVQLARVLAKTARTDRALLHYTEGIAHLERAASPLAAEARAEQAALTSVPGQAH